jgi:alpha-ketoglutarate-dependent taurine dioxygenase
MDTSGRMSPPLSRFRRVRPKAISLTEQDLVSTQTFNADHVPLVVTPTVEELSLEEWAHANRSFIEACLLDAGAILFRAFSVGSAENFERAARAVTPELLDYTERAAPRTEVTAKVFTSTEFPADQVIPLHHEMSYSHNWPAKLWFYCEQPARARGRTPLANDRVVFRNLGPAIKAPFIDKKVMYVRNYGEGVDLTWQEAFQTDDPAVVEEYCRASRTIWEWRDGWRRLRTRQVRQAVARHPVTGETVWFNHAHLFHPSSLPAEVRTALLSQFAEDELPRNVYYGDGSSIDPAALEEIRRTYDEAATAFDWQAEDVLLIDNFLVSHGREPFEGPRRLLVAMAELFTNTES